MTIRRRGRLDPDRADRLLDRASGGAPHPGDRLTRLLAAAARPAPTGAIAGEDGALQAFRGARETPLRVAVPRRRVGRVAGAGAWVAVAATTATAGVAFAATTHPWAGGRPASPPATPGAPAAVPPGLPTQSGTSGSASAGAPGQPGTSVGGSASAARPQLIGLCRSYLAKSREERGRSLDATSSASLIEAAGDRDRDRVDAYCTQLLAEPSITPAPASPTHGQTVPPGHEPSHEASRKPTVKTSAKQRIS